MTAETLAIARAREATDLTCAEIDVARVLLLDELEAANERLSELSFAAALPGGDDQAMIKQELVVSRIKQKLAGLAHGYKQAEHRENAREAAQRLVNRRAAAVDLLSLVDQRYSAAVGLDRAVSNVMEAIERLEYLGGQISDIAVGWSNDGSKRGEENLQGFLRDVGCFGMTDIAASAAKDMAGATSYSRSLPFTRSSALRSIAIAIPEVLDADVQAEAKEAARIAKAGDAGG